MGGPRLTSAVLAGVMCALGSMVVSCAGAAGSSRIEDKARRDVPIAICRIPLTARNTSENGAPLVEAYWGVLFPSFRGFTSPLSSAAPDCVGDSILAPDKAVPPVALTIAPSDSTIVPGEDGLEAVWLRASPRTERMSSGVLALVRPRPAELDVYAIGAFRGNTRHSRFEFARMGPTMVLVAHSDDCADVTAGSDCESILSLYLVSGGQLSPVGKVSTERVSYGMMKDMGRVQWRLTTDPPVFGPQTMHIKEKLSLHDSRDDEVRKTESERIFTLHGTELTPNAESIWSQVSHP